MFYVHHTILLLLIPALIVKVTNNKKSRGELFFMKFKTCMAYLHVQYEQSKK
jgi:hypothetical protein